MERVSRRTTVAGNRCANARQPNATDSAAKVATNIITNNATPSGEANRLANDSTNEISNAPPNRDVRGERNTRRSGRVYRAAGGPSPASIQASISRHTSSVRGRL